MILPTPRDQQIIDLVRDNKLTLAEIAKQYGLSRQRIHQIVQRHLKRQYVDLTPQTTPERNRHGL